MTDISFEKHAFLTKPVKECDKRVNSRKAKMKWLTKIEVRRYAIIHRVVWWKIGGKLRSMTTQRESDPFFDTVNKGEVISWQAKGLD